VSTRASRFRSSGSPRLEQDQVNEVLGLQRGGRRPRGRGLEGAPVAATDAEQPVHLPRHRLTPAGIGHFGHVEDEVVRPLHLREPFGWRAGRLHAYDGDGVVEAADLACEAVHQRPQRAGLPRGHEAEDRGLADRALPGLLARAQDHQARELGHDARVGLAGLEEGVPGEGEDFRVTQGHHVRRVRRAGDQGHLAGGLSGTDHAEELRLLAGFPPERSQAPRPHHVEVVRRLPGSIQPLAARQRKPERPLLDPRMAEEPREGRIAQDVWKHAHSAGG
jgi:hypothetical protein